MAKDSALTGADAAALEALPEAAAALDSLPRNQRFPVAASLPDFLVFQRAEPGRGRVPGTYLAALGHLGLGDIPAAKRAFRRALSLAVDHLESALRLAELHEAGAMTVGRRPGQASSGPAPSTARTTHIRGSRPVRAR